MLLEPMAAWRTGLIVFPRRAGDQTWVLVQKRQHNRVKVMREIGQVDEVDGWEVGENIL